MAECRYAAIDIGTVTCRLLVADVVDGHLHELQRECAITNLGEDVDATGVLKLEAMQRVDDQMARFQDMIAGYTTAGHPVRTIALATSASRDAQNAADFQAMLARRGITLTVIPGSREAALSFLGASAAFSGENLLVTDIGGGSTELIAGVGGGNPAFKHSFDVGCRRVTERFIHADPPAESELQQAIDWFRPQFADFFEQLRRSGTRIDRMVSVAGTATTVVSVDQAMTVYDSARVNGTCVSRATLKQVTNRLAGVSLPQRVEIAGLQPGRAPVIVAGMIILDTLMGLAGVDCFTVSESDILQGIIMDDAAR